LFGFSQPISNTVFFGSLESAFLLAAFDRLHHIVDQFWLRQFLKVRDADSHISSSAGQNSVIQVRFLIPESGG
jgi:hypothetical protein